MILGALLFHLLVWVGPVAALVACYPNWRRSAYGLVPAGLLVHGFLLGTLSAILHPALAPHWQKLVLVEAVAVLGTWAALRFVVEPRLRGLKHPAFSAKALLLCGLGAALATADLVAIFSGQGFAFEKGKLFHAGETYFRPPMNNDLTRHTVIVNSLLRKAESTPFLPNSKYSYQLYWHHFAALSVGPLADWWQPEANYPLVMGHVTAVALLFFFMLLWGMHARRPALFESRWFAVAMTVLVLAHADVIHLIATLATTGSLGIEADWSGSNKPYRNFSAKLMGLTAPQHALFFFFFLGFLERRRWMRDPSAKTVFAIPCFVASPVLSLFVFPIWWAGELARLYDRPKVMLKRAGECVIAGLAGLAAYTIFLRANPVDLVTRPGASGAQFASVPFEQYAYIPILWACTAGFLGLLAPLAFRKGRWAWPGLAVLLVGLPFFNFVVTAHEIRRHFSMVVAVISAVYLVRAIPRWALGWRRAVGVAALLSLPLHAYFVYCYLGKPSSLDPAFPWHDYYSMNKILREKFPGATVLAAVQPGSGGIGLEKPITMEATTSFSVPFHTAAHTMVSESQMRIFSSIYRSGETLPYGAALGYKYTVWGPVEDRVWGERNRRRFIDGNEPVARAGSVGLYEIRDSLALADAKEPVTRDLLSAHAETLAKAEYPVEAIETCERLMQTGQGTLPIALQLARLQLQVGDANGSLRIADMILAQDPNQQMALALRGGSLIRLGRPFQAAESYRHLLTIDPKDLRAKSNLALVLNQVGDFLGAEEQIRPVAQLATATPAVLIHFAQSLLGQQRYKEAVEPLQRCLSRNSDPRVQLEAHIRLGEAFAGMQQREPASFHYGEVLKIDPGSPAAQAFFRSPPGMTAP